MSDIDHIPIDWQKLPLKRVADVTNSGCYGDDDESDERSEPLKAITTAHIDPLSGFKTENASVRYFSRREKSKYVGRPGDIFVVKSSGSNENVITGKRAQIRDEDDLVFTNFLLRVRANQRSNPRFLYHLLGSSLVHSRIKREVATTTYPNLNLRQYLGEPLPIPDLPIQRAIADFLDRETARIDLLIEKKQRLVALLGEKTRSVINRATTVGFRDCETRISDEKWLGEVASHWRITPIKWFARLQSGYAFKADRFGDFGTPLVRMNNLKRGVLDLSDAVSIADDDVNESVLLRAGDILIGMSGSIGETGSLGNFAIVTERDLPCLLNQRVGRFQIVGKDLLPEYLTLVIQSAAFLDPIFLAATSTAQFNVSPSQIGSVLFALPPIVEQQEIVDEISKRLVGLNHVKERSLISIDRLREYRSALITAAVTGQINVSEWGKAGTNERHLDAIQAEMKH